MGGSPGAISDDLKWFKRITMGKPMIMGRKTWDSIGEPLPGRESIVVTSQTEYDAQGASVASSLKEAFHRAQDAAARAREHEICVIGGAAIYEQTLPLADRIYLTAVHAEVAGDVMFPSLDFSAWRCVRVAGAEKSARNEHSCDFFILDRQIRNTNGPQTP